MVCETLGRPRSVCRLRRRRKPSGLQSAIGQQDRSPILKSSPSTRPPSSVTAPRLPLCRPLSRHSALPSGTATLSRRSASSSPGFLNIDWRSGFADSNPSWFGPSTRVTPRRDLTCRHPETAGDEVHPPDEALRLARDLPEQRLDAGKACGLDQPLFVAHPQAPLAQDRVRLLQDGPRRLRGRPDKVSPLGVYPGVV